MPGNFEVSFIAPSYLMYGDETGQTKATATFSIGGTSGPATKQVLIPTNKYIQVGGGEFGGPELISVQISGDSIDETIFPDENFTAGANSYSVLNRPTPGLGVPYELNVRSGCLLFQVLFSPRPPMQSRVMDPVLVLKGGEIFNDLDAGQLSVQYTPIPYHGTEAKETPFVPRGLDTGGVFSGVVLSFNIETVGGPLVILKFRPEEFVQSTPMLPVGVVGGLDAPKLAVVRPWPKAVEFVNLVPIE